MCHKDEKVCQHYEDDIDIFNELYDPTDEEWSDKEWDDYFKGEKQ